MTNIELKYLSTVPSELREIKEQLEKLNDTLVLIAKVMNERK